MSVNCDNVQFYISTVWHISQGDTYTFVLNSRLTDKEVQKIEKVLFRCTSTFQLHLPFDFLLIPLQLCVLGPVAQSSALIEDLIED